MLSVLLYMYVMYSSNNIYSIKSSYKENTVVIQVRTNANQYDTILYNQLTCTPAGGEAIFFSTEEEEKRFCNAIKKLEKVEWYNYSWR